MKVFNLELNAQQVDWCKQQAKSEGARLLQDAEDGTYMWMGADLPESLKPFEKKGGSRPITSTQNAVKKAPSGPERFFGLDVPFEMRSEVQKLGVKWDGDLKGFFYKGSELPEGLASLKAPMFSWEYALQNYKNQTPPKAFGPQGEPYIPKPHQQEASLWIEAAEKNGHPGALLADEVGLGKTISAWYGVQRIARNMKAKTILVVSPLSVVPHWRQTILKIGSFAPDVLILNYDRLGKLFQMPEGVKVKKKSRSKSVAKKGEAPELDLIIFDESHKLKNPTSARSKLALKLAQKANFCLYLSATAGQTPLELSYLSKLIAHATGVNARNLNDFEAWCQSQGLGVSRGKFGKWEWSGNPADSQKLKSLLFDGKIPLGMRRRPEQIAGWPEINRQIVPQSLNPQERQWYLGALKTCQNALRLHEEQKSIKKGAQGPSKESTSHLVEVLRFRQKSSLIRVSQTLELAENLFEEGIKPAISCAFKETATMLKEGLEKSGLKVSLIWGSSSATERENERLKFQKGQTDAIVFTVEEGISLHQGEHENVPRALIIHDLRWSAIQMAQIEGRCHRNGSFAQAYWVIGEDTIEEKMAHRVAKRTEAMKTLSGDEDSGLEKEMLNELIKAGLYAE